MERNDSADPLLSYPEAAEFLGYAEGTLRNKVAAREIPHVKVGHRVRFRRSQLEAWRAAQIVEVHPDPAEVA